VAGVVNHTPFVLVGGSYQTKENLLRLVHRIHEIETPIHHQHWSLNPQGEIELVGLGELFIERKTRRKEHQRFKPVFHRRRNRANGRTIADALIREFAVIDFGPGFEVINRATEILGPCNGVVPVDEGVLRDDFEQRSNVPL
jgi:hypothetical protein